MLHYGFRVRGGHLYSDTYLSACYFGIKRVSNGCVVDIFGLVWDQLLKKAYNNANGSSTSADVALEHKPDDGLKSVVTHSLKGEEGVRFLIESGFILPAFFRLSAW